MKKLFVFISKISMFAFNASIIIMYFYVTYILIIGVIDNVKNEQYFQLLFSIPFTLLMIGILFIFSVVIPMSSYKKNNNKLPKKKQLSSNQIITILTDYGKFIEDNAEPLSIRDVSLLPHTKENILTALTVGIVLSKNEYELNSYTTLSIVLSDFQENVGTTSLRPIGIDPSQFKNYSDEELAKRIVYNPNLEKYEQFKKISEKDLDENILPRIKIAKEQRNKNINVS